MLPLLILAVLGAAYVATRPAPGEASGEAPQGAPLRPLDARARLPQPSASGPCTTAAADLSLLDTNAVLSWAACDVRTAQEVATVLARLAEQARVYPDGGYAATADTLRTQWNQRMDTEESQVTPAPARTTSRAPRARTSSTRTQADAARAYDERKRQALGVPQAPNATRSTPRAGGPDSTTPTGFRGAGSRPAAELEAELVRAEELLPGARNRFRNALANATPSELRAAADQIEDHDSSFVAIPRALRARAAERESR